MSFTIMWRRCTTQIYSTDSDGSFPRLFGTTKLKPVDTRTLINKMVPIFIKWCLYLRHLSGRSYKLLQKAGCVELPLQSTFRDYTYHILAKVGFPAEVDWHLFDAAFLSNNLNKYTMWMKCTSNMTYIVCDKHNGSIIGFVDLSSTNNQLLTRIWKGLCCWEKWLNLSIHNVDVHG